jgi:integrase
MKNRYGYFQRANGVYYALDLVSQRQTSLKTRIEDKAKRLVAAKNQASDTPMLNRAMAKVYASASSPELMERKWQEVMDAYAAKSVETTRSRVARAFRSEPFRVIARIKVNETDASAFWAVLNHKKAGNSTNHYLRRLQNFAWGMRWLFEPIIPGPEWPKVKKKRTIAISSEEHARIIRTENNPEHRRYYQMLWETGGSQSDIANLTWERIDRQENLAEEENVSRAASKLHISQPAISQQIHDLEDEIGFLLFRRSGYRCRWFRAWGSRPSRRPAPVLACRYTPGCL